MTNLTLKWLVVAAAGLVLAAAVSAQQKETGTVTGTVRRPGGPVASARVVIDSGSDSKYTGSATTDRNGHFTIADAPVGPIGVKVYDASDHILAQARGTLSRGGETITLTIQAP
jgi:Carboxypeptidase regulatory-like domain